MKRYLLFHGDCYYPNRGMEDFLNSYDNLDEAINHSIGLQNGLAFTSSGKWVQIYCTQEMKIIYETTW